MGGKSVPVFLAKRPHRRFKVPLKFQEGAILVLNLDPKNARRGFARKKPNALRAQTERPGRIRDITGGFAQCDDVTGRNVAQKFESQVKLLRPGPANEPWW